MAYKQVQQGKRSNKSWRYKKRSSGWRKFLTGFLSVAFLVCCFLVIFSSGLGDGIFGNPDANAPDVQISDKDAAAEQQRLEAERLEAERLEAARLEAERLAKEQQELEERLQREREEAEEAERAKRQAIIDYALAVARGEETPACVMNNIMNKNPEAKGMVALTFDDGPFKNISDRYLDVLKEYDVKATFFVLGDYINKRPDIAARMVAEGHELASHSFRHAYYVDLKDSALEEDFNLTAAAAASVGVEHLLFCRPPYGSWSKRVTNKMAAHDMIQVMWSVDPRDWETTDVDKVVANVVNVAKDGDIIIMHENRESTLEALPRIIEGLRAKGLEIVTVGELLYQSKLAADEREIEKEIEKAEEKEKEKTDRSAE